jgi:hypothetical protein
VAGLYVYRFLLAVVNCARLSTLGDTLRRSLGCVFGRLFLQLVKFVESLLEGCSHGIALQKGHAPDQVVFAVCLAVSAAQKLDMANPTLIFWQVVRVNLHREVVARLGIDNVRPVLALQDRLGAILDQLLVALDAQRH